MMKDITLIWILVQFLVNANYSQQDICVKELENAKWQLIYENDIQGNRVFGSKSQLMMAVLSGAYIRVGFTDVLEVFDEAKNIHIHSKSNVISAELSFDLLSQWVFVIVDTNGNHLKRIYHLGRVFVSEKEQKTGVRWFAKKTNCGNPTYFYSKRTVGSLSTLRDSVKKGFTISTVSKTGGVTSVSQMNSVHISSNSVYGQQTDGILSKELDGNRLIYQSNISRVFKMFSTDNTIQRSTWDLAFHNSRGYTKEDVTISWFADTQWKQVYSHSKNGISLGGSKNELVSAILDGRRVRFQLPDSSFFTTGSVDHLIILNGHVTARALRVAVSKTSNGLDRKGIWEWLMVSTTGAVETTRYQVGDQNHENVTSEKQQIVWFVDTTKWNLAFESDSNGNVINGTKETLIKKIRAGAAVRCVMRNEAGVIRLPSLVITKKGVVEALAPSNIEVKYVLGGFKFPPYTIWWNEIIDTTGRRVITRCHGRSTLCALGEQKIGFKWFTNE